MAEHILYVYGTLRPKTADTVDIPGYLHRVSWFPGVRLGGTKTFKASKIVVDDARLMELDRYEGYRPDDHESSLFIRVPVSGSGLDEAGEIYVFNGDLSQYPVIESGDWFKEGVN